MRVQIRRPKRETAAAGAAPAGVVRSHALGRLRDPPLGHYDPCARSSLTAPVHRGEKRGPELSRRRKRVARAAPARGQPGGGAIPPVISGDPEMDLTARQVTGCGDPHQRLSALCSPHFFRELKRTRATGALPKTGGRSIVCTIIGTTIS